VTPKVELGDLVQCRMTGFTGIVNSICTYLFAESSIGVLPRELKDGKIQDQIWLPEVQLNIVEKNHAANGGMLR
jgi:hypothetical protein